MPALNLNMEPQDLLAIAAGKITERLRTLQAENRDAQRQLEGLSQTFLAIWGALGIKPEENPLPAILSLKEKAAELERIKGKPVGTEADVKAAAALLPSASEPTSSPSTATPPPETAPQPA
jgi:hypothetical protein